MPQSNGTANGHAQSFRHISFAGSDSDGATPPVRRRKNGNSVVQLDKNTDSVADPSLLALLNWMIMPPTINMAVMGASGCGKTSIVNQFLYCQYSTMYQATTRPTLYQSHVVLEDRIYELHLYDCPAISIETFENPTISLENALFGGGDTAGGESSGGDPQDAIVDAARLRSVCRANAYILVFDLTMPITFDYIRTLRGVIMRRHVAATKAVALANAAAAAATGGGGGTAGQSSSSSSAAQAAIAAAIQDHHGLIVPGASTSGAASTSAVTTTSTNNNVNVAAPARYTPPVIIVLGAKLDNCQRATSHMSATTANMDSTGQPRTNRFRREVTKQWKAPYMEVSARYNCNIFNAFKTLAREVDSQQNGRKTAERLLDNVRRKQCIIC